MKTGMDRKCAVLMFGLLFLCKFAVKAYAEDWVYPGESHVDGDHIWIELPGERRVIDNVELWYSKAHWEHKPQVTLFGLK
jgi:hypothetical protein